LLSALVLPTIPPANEPEPIELFIILILLETLFLNIPLSIVVAILISFALLAIIEEL